MCRFFGKAHEDNCLTRQNLHRLVRRSYIRDVLNDYIDVPNRIVNGLDDALDLDLRTSGLLSLRFAGVEKRLVQSLLGSLRLRVALLEFIVLERTFSSVFGCRLKIFLGLVIIFLEAFLESFF